MREYLTILCLALIPLWASAAPTDAAASSSASLDYDIPGGHFFTQANGQPLGTSPTGYSVTNEGGIPFWDAFQSLGGEYVLGYPVTTRFIYDGFVTQAMQKMVFQWRPDSKEVWFLNTFDALHDRGKDDWLLTHRQTPLPFDTSPDASLSWEQVVNRHLAFLDQNQAIKDRYFSDPQAIDHFGLPVAYADEGNTFVIRAQRATFQYWKEDVPWAKAGEVTVANGGDLAKEAGLWPTYAAALSLADGSPVQPIAEEAAAPSTPTTNPEAIPAPVYTPRPGVYQANSPEYGMNMFIGTGIATTQRDLQKVTNLGFGWQKSLLSWRDRDYFDVLGAHAPGYRAPPEMSPDQVAADPSYGGNRPFTFRRVEDLRNVMVKNGDGGKQVWITEFGWTTDTVHPEYSWFAVSEDQKANYLVRAFQWARNNWAPWIGVMTVWTMPDPAWPDQREETWWAVTNTNGTVKPAYLKLLQARQTGVLP